MKFHILYDDTDAIVNVATTHRSQKRYYNSTEGKKVRSTRALVYDRKHASEKILNQEKVADNLKNKDEEIDLENAGRRISRTAQVVVNENLEPEYNYKIVDILEKPTGERIERSHLTPQSNVNESIPLRITKKLFEPLDLIRNYIFRKSYFITHDDAITYKFLYQIAKKLHEKKAMARVQAYDQETKKIAPLILYNGGTQFPAAFLEGRIDGETYCLILHLSDREFKIPGEQNEADE